MNSEPTTTYPAWPDYHVAISTDWYMHPRFRFPGHDHTKVAVMAQTTINGQRIAATVLTDPTDDPTDRIKAAFAAYA